MQQNSGMEKRINRGNCKADAKSGEQNKVIQIAKNMLKKDINIDLIAEITGLAKEKIEKLKQKEQ